MKAADCTGLASADAECAGDRHREEGGLLSGTDFDVQYPGLPKPVTVESCVCRDGTMC